MLRLEVHFDAARINPVGYLRCLWWWIIGKRLRAQMGLAPLLGRSPKAYRLWQARQPIANEAGTAQPGMGPTITALVAQGPGIDATLASLARNGIEAQLIASADDLGAVLGSSTEWILPIQSDDLLALGAGASYRAAAASSARDQHIIYADDDLIDANGQRSHPHLKPDWNAELFAHFDFLTGAAIMRNTAGLRVPSSSDNWPAHLIRQAVDLCRPDGKELLHLHRLLHHRRQRPLPELPIAPAVAKASGVRDPSVSIIIPTRNRSELLRTCLEGVANTEYTSTLEVLVIDNGSDDPETLAYLAGLEPDLARVLRDDGPFNFAALNNRAVRQSSGEVLCFLNNDIEIREPDWLTVMARQAMRDDVGAVGARLLYPNGLIQHAGVVLGIGGAAAHAHRMLSPQEEGYFHRHSLPQLVSAVTAACLVVRRDRFDAVGGFDEENFAVSFNDVDMCLRLAQKGWQSLYEPRATLIHHESVSRGLDRDPEGAARQARETAALQERWNTGLVQSGQRRTERAPDPFHHRELSRLSEQFVLRL